MPVTDLLSWIDRFARQGMVWCAKRLSANDTLANGSHQAGPYFPKDFLFDVFPSINRPNVLNPNQVFDLYIDSHSDHREVRVIWYNNRFHGGTRNETRITRFGGQESAILNSDSTGSLVVFVFSLNQSTGTIACHVWVCDNPVEEDLIEDRIGPVEPKFFVIWRPGSSEVSTISSESQSPCWLSAEQIPQEWLTRFPTGQQIIQKTSELRPDNELSIDQRLVRRRDCEYEIFKSVEEAVYFPRIHAGFTSLDGFLSLAQTILQSRKSRAGTSLELHTKNIMVEENLVANSHFSYQPVIEGNKRPDFLFPNTEAYNDGGFPKERLRMLAVKTTCKDRWRQITTEADRIPIKHLLTLQEGVSENQFREMQEENVSLVVPSSLHTAYPPMVRPFLMSFEGFIAEVRNLQT